MSLLDLSVRDLLVAVADRTPAPGGGGAAALATALAAALAGMAARYAPEPGAAPAAADALRDRAEPLADADAAAYREFLAALRLPRDDPARPAAVERTRAAASAVPAEIAAIAHEVAALAAGLARDGNPNLRGDALAAVALAEAAITTADGLVAANAPPPPSHTSGRTPS
ncbi:cyclodeaminase/cyclohydrolase family protein [Pseudonocardia sp. GCM10023141]|uniref:cyclodeaminase/cyclohydrolase family protein n=1 Tax=Pseudonocardia sp. GCM10023141 TaxID=3252653 RepID=UPI003612EC08